MSEQPAGMKLTIGCISDRGLSEKRPLNEDSFLADPERRIFAVADGVGGADSGEVASQTAVEVLDDAFQHHTAGEDAEDLMEIAIQRANQSIHQMAREHSKLSMMATTLVALYIDSDRATIGHVGDSRLYRLTPHGQLKRETADHSVVEEEVRAGRMTPEQAAHHPSRNVISRALGAEASVEADMKMIEIAPGTTFLLCSDGITRHIPDKEIEQLLNSEPDLDAVCEKMKEICYERGAEDNLTAIIVRVGDFDLHRTVPASNVGDEDGERTLLTAKSPTLAPTAPLLSTATMDTLDFSVEETSNGNAAKPSVSNDEPLRTPNPAQPAMPLSPARANTTSEISTDGTSQTTRSRRKVFGAAALTILLPLIIAATAALGVYGGMYWERRQSAPATGTGADTAMRPSGAISMTQGDSLTSFERQRQQINSAPSTWLRGHNVLPADSADPEYLYLYGRAQLLSGQHDDAVTTLRRSLEVMDRDRLVYPDRNPLRIETQVTMATAAMMSGNQQIRDSARRELESAIETRVPPGDLLSPPKPGDGVTLPQISPSQ